MKPLQIKQLQFGLKPIKNTSSKKKFRFLDSKRTKNPGSGADIINQSYDPNRTAKILLLLFSNGTVTYILMAQLSKTQSQIYNLPSNPSSDERGWSNYLKYIPLGTIIHNLEIKPGYGGQAIRAAGSSAVLIKKKDNLMLVKLKSGAQRYCLANCTAVKGIVGNQDHFLRNLKKAGTSRNLGIKPTVRAASKNPVDHPLGGRTRGGIHPQNKNGLLNGSPTARKKRNHLEYLSARKVKLFKKK